VGLAILFAAVAPPFATAGTDTTGLWMVGRDGSKQRLAVPEGDNDFGFTGSWSRDGTRVAYTFGSKLVVQQTAGPLTRTTVASGADEPIWSPTVDRIAFVAGSELRTVSPNGSDIRTVAKARALDHIRWSPDGRKLLFVADSTVRCRLRGKSFSDSTTAIFVVAGTGGTPKRLTSPSPCNPARDISDVSPEWLTRNTFTFVRNADNETEDIPLGSRLYTGDIRSTKLRRLAIPTKPWNGLFADLSISKGGKLIAILLEPFFIDRDEAVILAEDLEVWVVPADGAAARRLKLRTEEGVDGEVSGPVFAPDGQIAVCESVGDSVMLINAATGKRRKLASFDSCVPYAWSPDGERLLVSVEELAR